MQQESWDIYKLRDYRVEGEESNKPLRYPFSYCGPELLLCVVDLVKNSMLD